MSTRVTPAIQRMKADAAVLTLYQIPHGKEGGCASGLVSGRILSEVV